MRSRLAAAGLLTILSACSQPDVDAALQRMKQQPRYDVYAQSGFFPNGAVMQPPPSGTVPRGEVLDSRLSSGRVSDGTYVGELPLGISDSLLARGRSRFDIFCAVCHGAAGDGESIVASNMVERPPPSLLAPAVRALPPGHLYQVIHRGFGRMPSYAAELSVRDRWAVVAYLRQLQARSAPGATADSVRLGALHSSAAVAGPVP